MRAPDMDMPGPRFAYNIGSRRALVKAGDNFFNFYNHDLVRVAVGIPELKVADPAFNADRGPVSIFALRAHVAF